MLKAPTLPLPAYQDHQCYHVSQPQCDGLLQGLLPSCPRSAKPILHVEEKLWYLHRPENWWGGELYQPIASRISLTGKKYSPADFNKFTAQGQLWGVATDPPGNENAIRDSYRDGTHLSVAFLGPIRGRASFGSVLGTVISPEPKNSNFWSRKISLKVPNILFLTFFIVTHKNLIFKILNQTFGNLAIWDICK